MQKSVFFKYLTAFVLIIFISFAVLTVINNSVLRNYATDAKREDAQRTAVFVGQILSFNYHTMQGGADGDSQTSFETYLDNFSSLVTNLLTGVIEKEEDRIIYITDADGNVLASAAGKNADEKDLAITAVPASVMEELVASEDGTYQSVGKMDGTFRKQRVTAGKLICDNRARPVGAVFTSESTATQDRMVATVNSTIFSASLWVMLAAIISAYFLSDRMISPLRSMTRTVKEYGDGNLRARAIVQGKDEVAELAVAFNNMAESIENTEKMRNAFLANVSHDLRTPMTTIAGFVDGMLNGSIPPEKHPEYLEVVSSEVHRLSRLVSQLLDISRLESGERKFTPLRFDVCEMARLILISFEQKINDKRLEIAFECDRDSMIAYSDKDAIHQVLYNLIDNALKFAKEGGLLRISITRGEDGKLKIAVYNEGIGISEEDLPYVFERFYKSDKSRGLDKTGTGLGLYIVKTVLEALHEKIAVESVSGEYCQFTFTLTEHKE